MSGSIFDKTLGALNSSTRFRQMKHNVASSNIANAETPGYKAKKLEFEGALKRAIEMDGVGKSYTSHPEHIPIGKGALSRVRADVYDNPEGNITNDKNTVDLEKEMAGLAENTLLYKAALQLINKKLASLKYAVSEGGR